MEIMIYGKKDCAKCTTTKNKFNHFLTKWKFVDKVPLKFVDMDTVEGRAKGLYNEITEVPTTLILNDSGDEIARWPGMVPASDDVRVLLGAK